METLEELVSERQQMLDTLAGIKSGEIVDLTIRHIDGIIFDIDVRNTSNKDMKLKNKKAVKKMLVDNITILDHKIMSLKSENSFLRI